MSLTLPQSRDPVDTAVELHEAALTSAASGDLNAAQDAIEKALRLLEEACGGEHPDVANILNARGLIAEQLGELETARQSFSRAEQICLGHTGDETDVDTLADIARIRVQALINLGNLERVAGNYEMAGQVLDQAVRLARNVLSADDLDTSNALNALGMWCKFTGRFARGREVYQQALIILRQNFGDDDSHPAIASLYHNLGGLEHGAGDFAAGEPFARKSVAIRLAALGDQHPDYAADVAALAALLADLGKLDEAETLYHEALAIFERQFGHEHYEIAVTLHNLAAVAVAREEMDRAAELYAKAADLKGRLLGLEHPDFALTRHNQAVLYLDLEREDEARVACHEALKIFEKNFVSTHPTLVACREVAAQLGVTRQ